MWSEENHPASYPKPEAMVWERKYGYHLQGPREGGCCSVSLQTSDSEKNPPLFTNLHFFIPFREWGGGGWKSATIKPLISGCFGFLTGVGGGFACREKPGRGRRGGRAASPGKVQGLPLTSAPNTARWRIHTLTPVTCLRPESGRVSSLSWPGREQDYHPSTA